VGMLPLAQRWPMDVELDKSAGATPHDALFKYIFSDPKHAASLLESVVPEVLLRKLDLATMKLVPGSFVDMQGLERRTDLLFSVRLKGRRELMYVLLEHQSTVDRQVVFRVQAYMVRIWEKHVKDGTGASHLPVVLPVVIFNGKAPWSPPPEAHHMFRLSENERVAFGDHLPRLSVVLDDLAALTPKELQRRGGTVEKRIAETLLARGRGARRLKDIRPDLKELFSRLGGRPGSVYTFLAFVTYVRKVAELEDAEMGAIAHQLGPEAEEAFMTTAEKLRREGRAKGRSEGRAKGRAEGRAETLQRLLALRFGPLSEEVVARVRQGDLQALDRWTDAVLTAPTLEEALR